jgi:hypothetical protein
MLAASLMVGPIFEQGESHEHQGINRVNSWQGVQVMTGWRSFCYSYDAPHRQLSPWESSSTGL